MKHKADITSFKKYDYLELKSPELLFVKVLDIQVHPHFVGMSKIRMKLLANTALGQNGLITWDFEYLSTLLTRVIQSPTEKQLIRLLYD